MPTKTIALADAIRSIDDTVTTAGIAGLRRRAGELTRISGGSLSYSWDRAWAVSCDLTIELDHPTGPRVLLSWSSTHRSPAAARAAVALYSAVADRRQQRAAALGLRAHRRARPRHDRHGGCAARCEAAAGHRVRGVGWAMSRFAIVAVYPDCEDHEAHAKRYTNAEKAGEAAIRLAWADAFASGGGHLVRCDQKTSIHDIETWCADSPTTAPIWAVRAVTFLGGVP